MDWDFFRSVMRRLRKVISLHGGAIPAKRAIIIIRMAFEFFDELFRLMPDMKEYADDNADRLMDIWHDAECLLPPASSSDEKSMWDVSRVARNFATLIPVLKNRDEGREVIKRILGEFVWQLERLRPRLRRDRDRIVVRLLRDFRTIRFDREGRETMTPQEQIQALQDQIKALKASNQGRLTLKVSAKGGVSLYGMGKWPVTLYLSQYKALNAAWPSIQDFVEANLSKFATKDD